MKLLKIIFLTFALICSLLKINAQSLGLDPNFKFTTEQIKSLEKKAKKGDYEAQVGLVSLYAQGCNGVEKDIKKAAAFGKKACETGLKSGDYIGLVMYMGILITYEDQIPNADIEIKMCGTKAVFANNPMGMAAFGDWLISKGYIKEGLENLNKAAFLGESFSMARLSHLYLGNEGVPADYETAFKWASSAAAQGNASGMNNLAYMYVAGIGTEQNDLKAIEWGEKAIALGYDASKNLISPYLRSSDPLQQEKGFKTLLTLQNEPNPEIWRVIATCYEKGKGTAIDFEKARAFYELAGKGGDEESKVRLLKAELYGELGISQNTNNAIYGFGQLVDEGSMLAVEEMYNWYITQSDGKSALLMLDNMEKIALAKSDENMLTVINLNRGDLYSSKLDIHDSAKALEYYKKIPNDDSPAYNIIRGRMFFDKQFGMLDYEKGVSHYRRVIESGKASDPELYEAYKALSTAYRYGRGVEADELRADEYILKAEQYDEGLLFLGGEKKRTSEMLKNIGVEIK